MRCQRSWMLGYYRNLQPDWGLRRTPVSFDTGNIVHAGLGGYYLGDHSAPHAERAIHAFRDNLYSKLAEEADMKAWDKSVLMAERMVEAYIIWVEDNGLDVGEDTIEVETRMTMPLGNVHGYDVYLHGQPDRLVNTPSGMVIEDWKTGDIKRQFLMESDWQLLNYIMMSRFNHGAMPVGARHRRLNRSMHTAAAKADQFAQHHVSVNELRLSNHYQHVMHQVDLLVSKKIQLDEGLDPTLGCTPNRNTQCSWDCSFKEVCPLMDDGADFEYILDNEFRLREDSE